MERSHELIDYTPNKINVPFIVSKPCTSQKTVSDRLGSWIRSLPRRGGIRTRVPEDVLRCVHEEAGSLNYLRIDTYHTEKKIEVAQHRKQELSKPRIHYVSKR